MNYKELLENRKKWVEDSESREYEIVSKFIDECCEEYIKNDSKIFKINWYKINEDKLLEILDLKGFKYKINVDCGFDGYISSYLIIE